MKALIKKTADLRGQRILIILLAFYLYAAGIPTKGADA